MIGTEIAGYRIDALLGQGGMALVYRAHQLALRRDVALKVIQPEFQLDHESMERFQREYTTMGRIESPHLVRVYDCGKEKGVLFYAMELMDAPTLYEVINGPSPRARLDPARALLISAGILDGLAAVHRSGSIHRDIKPGNIFFHPERGPVLADFGLAKSLTQATHLTQAGSAIGTVNYMSPEQCLGEEVGPSSDVYAAALIVYEMIALRRPFLQIDVAQQMYAHVQDEPPDLRLLVPGLPSEVNAAVQQGLAKLAADRPPSAAAYAEELRRLHAQFYGEGAAGHSGVESRAGVDSRRVTRPRATRSGATGVRTGPAAAAAGSRRFKAIAAVLGALACVAGVLFVMRQPGELAARDIKVTPGLHRARLTFETVRAVVPIIEYWSKAASPATTAATSAARIHDIALTGLRDATDYSVRVLSDGAVSPVFTFRTSEVLVEALKVTRGLDRATLSFTTSLPVRTVANFWPAGKPAASQSRSVQGAPTTTHTVVLDQLEPDSKYTAVLGFLTDDLESTRSPEISVPGGLDLLNQLSVRVKTFDAERTIATMKTLLLKKVGPLSDSAGRVRQTLLPQVNELKSLARDVAPLASRFFNSRDVYVRDKVTLYQVLTLADHIDRFCAREHVDLSTGMSAVDRGPFRSPSKEELLHPTVVPILVDEPRIFMTLDDTSVDPLLFNKRKQQKSLVPVRDLPHVARAELVFDIEYHSPDLYFEVSINGQGQLVIPGSVTPPPPGKKSLRYYHHFPPELLIEGDNTVEIVLKTLPGLMSMETPFIDKAAVHLERTE